jgi:HTH-type transcriptional regulator / antitoxin HigA
MSESMEFIYFLNQEALKGIHIESPGPAYDRLCKIYPLQKIKVKSHHEAALKVLTKLSEYLSEHEPEAKIKKQVLNYMDALGLLVEEYEKEHFSRESEKISGSEVLEFLMEQHGLKQNDLTKELGAQSIVSEILAGKRKLNNNQIAVLSKRFGVSPAVFFPV